MQRPWSASQPSKARRGRGFILLYTLWLLLGGAVLFAALSAASISRSRSAASELAALQVRAALETAVHASVFELMARRHASGDPPVTRNVRVDGIPMSVEVVDQAGLLDVNAASVADLTALLARLGVQDAATVAAAVVRARPVVGLWQLAPALNVVPHHLDCLAAVLTFSSGLSRPDVRLVPHRLARLLDLPSEPSGHQGIGVNLSGSGIGYVIRTQAGDSQGRGGALTAAVILGGRRDNPVLVTDWYWHSSAKAECPWSS